MSFTRSQSQLYTDTTIPISLCLYTLYLYLSIYIYIYIYILNKNNKCLFSYLYICIYIYLYIYNNSSNIHHKSLNTSEIFEQWKNQIMKKHWKMWLQSQTAIHTPNLLQNNTRRKTRKIIWFNQPFSLNVKTNLAKIFFELIGTHLPPASKLHKILSCNTVIVSCSCTQNITNYKRTW